MQTQKTFYSKNEFWIKTLFVISGFVLAAMIGYEIEIKICFTAFSCGIYSLFQLSILLYLRPLTKLFFMENAIEIYQSKDGLTSIEVTFDKETVWLTQKQLADLFQRDRTVITKHINNVFKEGELDEKLVCANFAHTTQHGAIKGKTQETTVKYYNLDVIISVGYRVKSKQGTQFREWATQRLKDYLVKGYAINEKRLQEAESRFIELKKAVSLLDRVSKSKELSSDEAQGLRW